LELSLPLRGRQHQNPEDASPKKFAQLFEGAEAAALSAHAAVFGGWGAELRIFALRGPYSTPVMVAEGSGGLQCAPLFKAGIDRDAAADDRA